MTLRSAVQTIRSLVETAPSKPKLGQTAQRIYATVQTAGKYETSSGTTRAGLMGRKLYPFNRRELAAINTLEKLGLVQVERKTYRSSHEPGSEVIVVVTLPSPDAS